MMNKLLVRDIMTRKVISVTPNDTLQFILDLFARYKFDGLPVIDDKGSLVGIITQYDLITRSSGLHLPTLEAVLRSLPVLKRDLGPIRQSFEDIQKLTAGDVMNPEPLIIGPDELAEVAAKIFVAHHRVNPIPVVAKSNRVIGIISRYDLIRLFDPHHFASALGEALGDVMNHEARGFEVETLGILKSIHRDFILVSRLRSILAYILFGVLGLLAAVAIFSLMIN